ncbi:Calmodulin [Monoraphidium neglectum]|uniref:Calmodulin n=1 Tax=Monoraphidium neglectum TaxID=145388 RepID=A0A0D2KVP0_9CHLO|nr:Calmodulin [Monoraphidium neglectum]KIY99453.1 Calmodulin [Monoraphidium neglectum]|eukprot:XP_013898473.1 Calmodulin [Monoraphidium neglectum]
MALSDQKIADIKEAFALFDQDNDGYLAIGELGTVMRALGRNPTEAQVRQLAKEVDPDGRGSITLQGKRRAAHRAEGLLAASEFTGVMAKDIPTHDSEADIAAAWKVFDKEGRGWISADELRHVLTSIGERLAPGEMDALLAEANPDAGGKIKFEDFVKLLAAK